MVRSPVESLRVLLIAAVIGVATSCAAAAAPRSIADCEAIKQADAYNQCLASFGPAAHTGPARGETPASSGERAAVPQPTRQSAHRASRHMRYGARGRSVGRRGFVVTRHKGGRVRTTIEVRHR